VTKILGGDSHSCFPLIKDKNSLSPHICLIDTIKEDIFAAMSHTCDTDDDIHIEDCDGADDYSIDDEEEENSD